mgnify:FL=1
MPLVSTLILNSLISVGEKALGTSSFTQNETSYYLSKFQSMTDSFGLEKGLMFALSQTSFGLTNSVGQYTIGPGGNFNMDRPTKLLDPCFIRDTSTDYGLTIISMEEYGQIPDKSADGSFPIQIAYDQGYSATSTGTVYLYPEPSAGLTLFINTQQPFQSFSTVTVNVMLPPGYQRMLESNFAVEITPGISQLDPVLAKLAKDSKAALKSNNLTAPLSRLDFVPSGRSNILTGP